MPRKKQVAVHHAELETPLELKKHVATIHSSSKLTLLQRKIANALLFHAYDSLLTQDEHIIHVAILCKLIGYDSHDHKTIKKALVNLLSTVIEWNLVDHERHDADGVWNASSIIADASIDGPVCTYSYSNKMRRLLYRPDMYGRLNMLVQAKFQSSYGLALYENCNRFQDIGKTPWFDLPTFRKLMGVEDGKYKVFRDFKTRVLDKAVAEVNKYSALCITAQLRRQRRQVVAVQFLIEQNQVAAPARLPTKKNTQADLFLLLKKFGLTKRSIDKVTANYDEPYIRSKVALIEQSSTFKKGQIKSMAKYLLAALKEDYQVLEALPAVTVTAKALPVDSVELDRMKRRLAFKQEEYRHFQDKQLMQLFERESQDEKNKLLKAFAKYLSKGIYHNLYVRDGLGNILVADQLCIFLKQNRSKWLEKVISFEEWQEEAIEQH